MGWKLDVFFLTCIFFGVLFAPSESAAQAVPPRVQSLQLIKRVTPPPELPVQKEIRVLAGEAADLERQIGAILPEKDRVFPPAIGGRRYVPPSGGNRKSVAPPGGSRRFVPPPE